MHSRKDDCSKGITCRCTASNIYFDLLRNMGQKAYLSSVGLGGRRLIGLVSYQALMASTAPAQLNQVSVGTLWRELGL